jgi:outer membrane receptor protein involved in Fe transport
LVWSVNSKYKPIFTINQNVLGVQSTGCALTRNASFTSNYYGNGKAGGYSIINLDTRYKFGDSGWQLFAKVNNLLDRDYYTGGLQGASMFNPVGSGYVGDDHRVSMMAPGAPRAVPPRPPRAVGRRRGGEDRQGKRRASSGPLFCQILGRL